MNPNFLYRGIDEPLPERTRLRAGPLALFYDSGDLRGIVYEGREIVRRIYVAVRDGSWGTIPARISNLSLQAGEESFLIEYDVENRQGEIDFGWHAVLRGAADGRVSFSMRGAARTTFQKNRIGFCVLLPAALAGQPARLEHGDGRREKTVFPLELCAEQPVPPFADLRGVSLGLGVEGGEAVLRMEGDTFEMEDQRLWTDASYKIFCTPLALAYPVEIQSGTQVSQKIELELRPAPRHVRGVQNTPDRADQPDVLVPPDEADWQPIPLLGLGTASHGQALTAREMAHLRALNLNHLRVDLRLADPSYALDLERAAHEAAGLGIGLEVALLVSAQNAEAELAGLGEQLQQLRPPVVGWLVYPEKEIYAGGSPTAQVLAAARRQLAADWPGVPFASGTNSDFIFLKRTPPAGEMEQVCIALNPQVHAFDDLSLLEANEGQGMVLESARRLAHGLPVVVSPVTLKPRFNPHASGPQPRTPPGMLPPQVDPRQRSLFGAGWLLGSLAALIGGGAERVTYFETSGWRGVLEREEGSPWPLAHLSLPGIVFPLYHVLADVGEFRGGQAALLRGSGADPQVIGLALRKDGRRAILLANPGSQPGSVTLEGLDGPLQARWLDASNVQLAMYSPGEYRSQPLLSFSATDLCLPPYSYLRLDGAHSRRPS